jgi:hypothetical protein
MLRINMDTRLVGCEPSEYPAWPYYPNDEELQGQEDGDDSSDDDLEDDNESPESKSNTGR